MSTPVWYESESGLNCWGSGAQWIGNYGVGVGIYSGGGCFSLCELWQ